MVVGQTREIFSKIDPLAVGEDYRSNLIAEQYAIRLNLKPQNLAQSHRVDGLYMLLRGYPSHSFVIDREEARRLFRRVDTPTGRIAELAQILGKDVMVPRNLARKEPPRLEYLNAEPTPPKAKGTAKGAAQGSRRRSRRKVAPASPADLRRRVPVRPEPEGGERQAA
jgi:hypothetical protein